MKRRKDGRYQKKVTVEKNSKVYSKWVYGRTKAEIERKEREYKLNIDNLDKPMFSELMDSFLSHVEDTKAYGTYIERKSQLKWWENYFGKVRSNDVTPEMIMDGLTRMQKAGNAKSTVTAKFTALKQMYAYGNVLYGDFPDPTRGVEIPTTLTLTESVEAPPKEVLQYVKNHVDSDPFGLFPYIILYSGLRCGEVLALKYEDCYDGYIHVNKTIVFKSQQETLVQDHTKTASGKREVPIFTALKPYLVQKKHGYIFGGSSPLTRAEFRRMWRYYQIGCENECNYHLRSHQLRHAFATACYNNNVDTKICAAWMGHKSIITTLNIYTTLENEKKLEEAKKMVDFF